ncbi:hypothetical protein ACSSV4_004051 [Roseovarius sp. MBR-154]|jgi:hypothetical protein
MKYCDHHDPKIFKECVSAITLKGRPQRLLEEWLTEAEVSYAQKLVTSIFRRRFEVA